MVKYFEDCEREAGLNSIGDAPELRYTWFAYKGGQAFGPFENRTRATSISTNVEKVVDPESKKAYDDYMANEKKFRQRAFEFVILKIHFARSVC